MKKAGHTKVRFGTVIGAAKSRRVVTQFTGDWGALIFAARHIAVFYPNCASRDMYFETPYARELPIAGGNCGIDRHASTWLSISVRNSSISQRKVAFAELVILNPSGDSCVFSDGTGG